MNIDDELIPYIDDLYQHARSKISFYKDIYINSPLKVGSVQDFYKLPQINDGLFVRCRMEEMITDYSDIYKVAYPEKKFTNDSTIPRVFNLEDLDNQYEILDWILEECGSFEKESQNSVALIMDEESSYGMGDIGQMLSLILDCPLFAIVVRGHSNEEIKNELARISPNTIFTSLSISDDALCDSVQKIYSIGNPHYYSEIKEYFNIWSNPYVGFIGYRKGTEKYYKVNSDFYIVETNKRDQIIVTSFMQKVMPMIRYQTRDYGKVIDNCSVEIYYQGTH